MKKGFTLLEVLVSITMLGILTASVFPVVGWLITRSAQFKYDSEAAEVLQEGAEAAYNIMLGTSNWASFNIGEVMHIQENAIDATTFSWTLDVGAEENINAKFKRWVTVNSVCRDGSSGAQLVDCSDPATLDPNSRLVQTFVEWDEPSGGKTIKAELLVVKI